MTADFQLTGAELRAVARFVAESAQEVLPVFESACPDDGRPRAAVDASWEFINGAERSKRLRLTSMEAHRAASAAPDEASRLAAQAAGDAASAAYLHPISKEHQVGHILRATANAARIAEIQGGRPEQVLEEARERATPTMVDVLRRYPPPAPGHRRVTELMAELDALLPGGSR
ncbi:putative immunity protein [Thermocrispum municipale]|uniref:putative immunity protein n=1 Tax=Thermocrispum municipale TaxID=37926 RepID=UPI0004181D2A|nr:hypothetical protein [Thermocrispum municipale]